MRPKFILTVFCLFLFLPLTLFHLVSLAQSQEISPESSQPDEPVLSGHLETAFASPALIATHIFTKTIEAVTPFSEYRYFYQMNISDMPSGTFTWNMSNQNPDRISDVFFDSTGGNGCVQQSDGDIVCDDVSSFYLEFRYTNIYTIQLNTKQIGAGANFTGFSLNHSVTLIYMEPLEFIESIRTATDDPIAPILHENLTVKWEILNTSQGGIIATFLDPRIELLFLPVLTK